MVDLFSVVQPILFQLKCRETDIVVTEPHFNFASIQETMNEIFFEEYEFKSILRTNASTLSSHQVCATGDNISNTYW